MDDVIQHLEGRIQVLIQQCEHLKQLNLKLRHTKSLLLREKEILLAKHKIAVSQIEAMVCRLKSIEKPL